MSLFVFATLLLLASCSKEPMLQTEETSVIPIETVEKISSQSKIGTIYNTASAKGDGVAVSKISSTVVGTDLIIDFSSSYDFSGKELDGTQSIDFVDASGKVSTLSFQVNSYTRNNTDLQVVFAIGGNRLSGLTIVVGQQIIIEELVVN